MRSFQVQKLGKRLLTAWSTVWVSGFTSIGWVSFLLFNHSNDPINMTPMTITRHRFNFLSILPRINEEWSQKPWPAQLLCPSLPKLHLNVLTMFSFQYNTWLCRQSSVTKTLWNSHQRLTWLFSTPWYYTTRKAQVAASLLRACDLAVIKPISGCVHIACSGFMIISLLQVVNRLDSSWLLRLCTHKLNANCFNDLQQVCKSRVVSTVHLISKIHDKMYIFSTITCLIASLCPRFVYSKYLFPRHPLSLAWRCFKHIKS